MQEQRFNLYLATCLVAVGVHVVVRAKTTTTRGTLAILLLELDFSCSNAIVLCDRACRYLVIDSVALLTFILDFKVRKCDTAKLKRFSWFGLACSEGPACRTTGVVPDSAFGVRVSSSRIFCPEYPCTARQRSVLYVYHFLCSEARRPDYSPVAMLCYDLLSRTGIEIGAGFIVPLPAT